jgi:hypothetical protein
MTICIGALAANAKAVVCVADKYITFNQEILGETDSVKIVPIGENGAHAMISGNDDAILRVLAKLELKDDVGKNRDQTARSCEEAYKEAEREMVEMRFLRPFITAGDYEKALLKKRVNRVIEAIADEISKNRGSEEPVFNCALLFCGFDEQGKPYILNLAAPGVCTDMTLNGFSAIGSGSGYALQRLLNNEWSRKYPIDRALYEVFDAKVQAENDMNVGYNWDAIILTAEKVVPLPDDTKKMIDRAWIMLNRSPYETHDPIEDVPLPPKDWMPQLTTFAETIIPSEPSSQNNGGDSQ